MKWILVTPRWWRTLESPPTEWETAGPFHGPGAAAEALMRLLLEATRWPDRDWRNLTRTARSGTFDADWPRLREVPCSRAIKLVTEEMWAAEVRAYQSYILEWHAIRPEPKPSLDTTPTTE